MSKVYTVIVSYFPCDYNYWHGKEFVGVFDSYEKAWDCFKREAKEALKDMENTLEDYVEELALDEKVFSSDITEDYSSEDGVFMWESDFYKQEYGCWELRVENPEIYEDDKFINYALIRITEVELNDKELCGTYLQL